MLLNQYDQDKANLSCCKVFACSINTFSFRDLSNSNNISLHTTKCIYSKQLMFNGNILSKFLINGSKIQQQSNCVFVYTVTLFRHITKAVLEHHLYPNQSTSSLITRKPSA